MVKFCFLIPLSHHNIISALVLGRWAHAALPHSNSWAIFPSASEQQHSERNRKGEREKKSSSNTICILHSDDPTQQLKRMQYLNHPENFLDEALNYFKSISISSRMNNFTILSYSLLLFREVLTEYLYFKWYFFKTLCRRGIFSFVHSQPFISSEL